MPKSDKNVTRIVIADDHTIFREGLRRLLESEPDMKVIGEAPDGAQAVSLVQRLLPDILLLDLLMPNMPGLDALRELWSTGSSVRVIVLAAAIEKPQIVQALQLGARGVVLKESATQILFESIRTVMGGGYWVGRSGVADMVQVLRDLMRPADRAKARNFNLTAREIEVVAAVAAGLTNKDIARKFNISEQTVKHHISSTFDKVGVSNRLELALFAINNRLVDEA